MARSPDLRRVRAFLVRVEHRATTHLKAVRVAREHHDALVAERARNVSDAQVARDALFELFQLRAAVDKRRLFALLHEAGQLRHRWHEAIAQVALLDSDIERAQAQVDASRAAALAARRRADRLNAWFAIARRRAEFVTVRSAHDLIEEDAWKHCLM